MNNQKRPALGKGIASLLQGPVSPEVISKAAEKMKDENITGQSRERKENSEIGASLLVEISMISPNSSQPRKIFIEKEIEELANSIKENGIIQPLVVSKSEVGFELISGERRLRAAKKLGLEKVPVVIKQVTEKEKMVMAIVENVQRSDLNCVEEALAYYKLMEEFHLTQEEVAKKIGKERSTIANFLRILKLPREVIDLLQKEQLSFGHAKVLAGITDNEKIKKIALRVVKENLSVRELERIITSSTEVSKEISSVENNIDFETFRKLEQEMERNLNLKIKVKAKNKNKGVIQIYFKESSEFNMIFDKIMKA